MLKIIKKVIEGWEEILFAYDDWQILIDDNESCDLRNLYFWMLPQGLNLQHLENECKKMNMKKIVLLNSAPGSGKDYAGNYIANSTDYKVYKFARILKERTHALYGLDKAWDYYEMTKDISLDEFMGLTPRQAYINVSQKYFKPVHGNSIFGDILAEEIKDDNYVIVTDCGFIEEIQPLINKYGKDSLYLIRIHREGYDFSNDSRGYIYPEGVKAYDINNDGVTNKYIDEILNIIND
jgi:hypothetical protein